MYGVTIHETNENILEITAVDDGGHIVVRCSAGAGQLNRQAAGKSEIKNWEEVANQSHKIKAPCKHMGADKLATFLKGIEEIARSSNGKDDLPFLINSANEESARIIKTLRKHFEES